MQPRGMQHASGVWVGQVLGGHKARPSLWTLTLIADAPAPSAYGASVAPDGSLLLLHGDWNAPTRALRLIERNGKVHRVYAATLQEDPSGIMTFQGTWVDSNTKEGGQFACCKEPDNADTYISGLWLGQAVPDATLADFMIPTNPIRWSLALLQQAPGGVPSAFGMGYFDDSGDIPNKPLLYFTLRGEWNPETRKVKFVKEYEAAAETDGFEVNYEGSLEVEKSHEPGSADAMWLHGTWRNEKGGSFGQFSARRQKSFEAAVAAICLCEVCSQPIKPGELRWTCATCLSFWCCCANCCSLEGVHPHALTPEAVLEQKTARGACCAQLALDALNKFAKQPFLGTRAPSEKEFKYSSYAEVAAVALDTMFGLRSAACPNRSRALFCAPLTPTYAAAMLGAQLAGCVIVPVQASLDLAALTHIIDRTCPSVVFLSLECEALVKEACKAAKLNALYVLLPSQAASALPCYSPASAGVAPLRPSATSVDITALASIGSRERKGRTREGVEVHQVGLAEVCAVLYTSGSTGVPKGVVFTEELCMPSEGVATVLPFIRLDFQSFDPSFLLSVLQTMLCGGQRIFSSSLTTLMDDFKIGRPTHIGATPVLWNSLYRQYVSDVSAACKAQETLPEAQRKSRASIEARLGEDIRRQLGNRLKVASSGGAAISPEVLHFARTVLRIDIVDLYGSRETGGIARDGVVYKGVDVQLKSIPELGYFSNGHPPRGEICVNSPRMVAGYWRDLKQTEAAFTEINGKRYYRTGDVGEWRNEKQGVRLRVIDRCGALLKLAQGEWISPAKIENTIEECPLVSQALVCGSSAHAHTVAIIVPSRTCRYTTASLSDAAVRAKASEEILASIRLWCTSHHMRPIEIPQRLHIELEPWTAENGLMTATEKKRRAQLMARYKSLVEALYERADSTASASPTPNPTPVEANLSADFVAELKRALPSLTSGALVGAATLGELGCDSLGAAVLLKSLTNAGVAMPDVRALFDFTLAHLSALYVSAKSNAVAPLRNCAADIDWLMEAALPDDLRLLDEPPAPPPGRRNDVFITGATGYLGPYLLRAIAAKATPGTRMYCLVRGANQQVAEKRLEEDMRKAQIQLATGVELRVLCGDLSRLALGLTQDTYNELLLNVSDVYHSGARVNMALPYSAMRASNVIGTIEVLRIAARAGARLHYVSSVAALPTSVPPVEDTRTFGGLNASQVEEKDGYGQSKAIAESILKQATELMPWLDVRVYRPATIAADSSTGHFNEQDFTVLLMKAALQLKCVVKAHSTLLHWLPVDFVANGIVALSRQPRDPNARVFHFTAEGPSLTDVVMAFAACGVAAEAVPPEEWRKRVATRITEADKLLFPVRELLRNFDWAAPRPAPLPTDGTKSALKRAGVEWMQMTPEMLSLYAKRLLKN